MLERLPGLGKRVHKVLHHAHPLRPLSGKEDRRRRLRTRLPPLAPAQHAREIPIGVGFAAIVRAVALRFGAECAVVVAGSFGVDRIAESQREKFGRSHRTSAATEAQGSHLGNWIYASFTFGMQLVERTMLSYS